MSSQTAHVPKKTFTTLLAQKEPHFPDRIRSNRKCQGAHIQRDAEARKQRRKRPCEGGRGPQVSCCWFEQHNRCRGAPSESQSCEQSPRACGKTQPCVQSSARPTSNSSVFQGRILPQPFPTCGYEHGQPCRPTGGRHPSTGIGSGRPETAGRR